MSPPPLLNMDNSEAVAYEERLIQQPYSVTIWLEYCESVDTAVSLLTDSLSRKTDATSLANNNSISDKIKDLHTSKKVLCERALRLLPGSYKLWKFYLDLLTSKEGGFTSAHDDYYMKRANVTPPTTDTFSTISAAFERALVRMNKMPRIWLAYLAFLTKFETKITLTRRTYDRALQSLPAPQHSHLWPGYVKFATCPTRNIPDTAVRVQRRFITFDPASKEPFANYLMSIDRWGEAATLLTSCIDDEAFVSPNGSTTHDLWLKLCDTCSKHPMETVKAVNFDGIIRAALSPRSLDRDKFAEMHGILWCKLADFYVRCGEFEKARGIYEEGVSAVRRVKDFSMIFDAYSRFEESTLEAKMAMGEDSDSSDDDSDAEDAKNLSPSLSILLGVGKDTNDIELALARAEFLMERRPLLLNSVLLRQNPHNVGEWHKRAELFMKMEDEAVGGPRAAMGAYKEAVAQVDAGKAVNGTPASLWMSYAKVYEDSEDVEGARNVYRACCTERVYSFKQVDDLAQVYAAWAEMELRAESWDDAMNVAREGVAVPDDYQMHGQQRAGGNRQKGGKVQGGLFRSIRLWNLYLDLEESLGSFDTCKAAYLKCLELGVATPQHILNLGAYLIENKYFEEAFSAYEKGLALFYFPAVHAKPIWSAYLEGFHERYGDGAKIERSRELYERCLEKCPEEYVGEFLMSYANLEEKFGLAKRALGVFERCAKLVPDKEKLAAYQLYIAKADAFFGATATRPIYEAAIAALQDNDAAVLCLSYSILEKKLGEIERGRAALAFGAQLVDPGRDKIGYWNTWHEFEVSHGNEETFKDMLRIKRTVSAAFSTMNYNAGGGDDDTKPMTDAQAIEMIAREEGVEASEVESRVTGFVKQAGNEGVKRAREEGGNSMEELEKQAKKIREAVGGGGGGEDDEIDLDDL